MKKTLLLPAAALLLVAACHRPGDAPRLDSKQDTLSWAVGENIARSLMNAPGSELDYELVQQAIRHTLDGAPQPLPDSVMRDALLHHSVEQQIARRQQARQAQQDVDRQQEAYFAQLAKDNPAVKRHPSGFYYEVLQQGTGENAQIGKRIKFDYRSYLMFGHQPYDQTYGRRQPIVHVVGRPMFQGLIDAMQLMNAGSIYRFYFPYQLAFGEKGSGDIPGYTPFIYEVELHEIFKN